MGKRGLDGAFRERLGEVELLRAHRLVKNFFERGAVARVGHGFEPLGRDVEGFNGDVVDPGEDVGLENGEVAGGECAGDAREDVVAVPRHHGDLGMALLGKITPCNPASGAGPAAGRGAARRPPRRRAGLPATTGAEIVQVGDRRRTDFGSR